MSGAALGLVQYVVVRSDLLTTLKWPVGAVIAQACHACTAAVHIYKDDDNMQRYLSDIDNMHKMDMADQTNWNSAVLYLSFPKVARSYSPTLAMVAPPQDLNFDCCRRNLAAICNYLVVLGIESETKLRNLSEKLKEAVVDHKLWIEQPEDIPTCLVTKPYPKEEISHLFKKLKLLKSDSSSSCDAAQN